MYIYLRRLVVMIFPPAPCDVLGYGCQPCAKVDNHRNNMDFEITQNMGIIIKNNKLVSTVKKKYIGVKCIIRDYSPPLPEPHTWRLVGRLWTNNPITETVPIVPIIIIKVMTIMGIIIIVNTASQEYNFLYDTYLVVKVYQLNSSKYSYKKNQCNSINR